MYRNTWKLPPSRGWALLWGSLVTALATIYLSHNCFCTTCGWRQSCVNLSMQEQPRTLWAASIHTQIEQQVHKTIVILMTINMPSVFQWEFGLNSWLTHNIGTRIYACYSPAIDLFGNQLFSYRNMSARCYANRVLAQISGQDFVKYLTHIVKAKVQKSWLMSRAD